MKTKSNDRPPPQKLHGDVPDDNRARAQVGKLQNVVHVRWDGTKRYDYSYCTGQSGAWFLSTPLPQSSWIVESLRCGTPKLRTRPCVCGATRFSDAMARHRRPVNDAVP